MSQALTREIRPLLPIVGVAFLFSSLPLVLHQPQEGVLVSSMYIVAICWCLMGAAVFGGEFGQRTMTLLLSQPVSRRRIWWEKMAVLGTGLLVSLVALTLCRQLLYGGFPSDAKPTLVVAFLCAFCTAPYLALVTRQTVGAVVFAILIPVAIILLVNLLFRYFLSPQALAAPYVSRLLIEPSIMLALVLYSGSCFWLGYRKFLRLQVLDSQSLELNLPLRLEAAFDRWFSGRHGPTLSLCLKELRLQRITLLTALIFCALVLLEFAVRAIHPGWDAVYFVSTVVAYTVILPFIAGAVSVAEERAWGAAQWQLTLPVSTRRQWAVKCVVTLSLVFLLGIILQMAALLLSPYKDFRLMRADLPDFFSAVGMVALYLLFTSVVMYASSLTANSLRAILTAFCALFAISAVCTLAWQVGDVYDSFPFSLIGPLGGSTGAMIVGSPALLGLILILAWFNFRTAEPSQNFLVVQGLVILSAIFFFVIGVDYDFKRIQISDRLPPWQINVHPKAPKPAGNRGPINYRGPQFRSGGQLQPGLPKKEDQ